MLQIRKYKIFGLAAFDLILAMVGMVILFLLMKKWHFPKLNTWNFVFAAIFLTIPVGIVTHVIFGINTTLNMKLGLSGVPP